MNLRSGNEIAIEGREWKEPNWVGEKIGRRIGVSRSGMRRYRKEHQRDMRMNENRQLTQVGLVGDV